MAYNPFNIFRRNQKALFAVLTVFIMIMFTLQSGVAGGDFFETIARLLGGGKGEVVCKIDGRKVTTFDLEGGQRSLQFKRLMANRFMYYAALETVSSVRDSANQQRDKLSPAGREMSDAVLRALKALETLDNPQLKQLFEASPQFAQQYLGQVQYAEYLVDLTITSPSAKSEDKDVARAYRTMFNLRRVLQASSPNHYFVNAPNKTRRDAIEFMLWEKKADQLGIKFSRDDVKQLIRREFSDFFTGKAEVEVVKELTKNQKGFTKEACEDALASEFRVRAAQAAVLGYSGRYHGAPVFTAPYEAFEYYRDQCSPTTYEVIAVPAAAWLDKVVGEPSETEINELFKKYANDEPNPKNESPGFKTPRKIAIGYLGITGDEPYYKKLAEEQIKIGEVMAKASGALTVPVPGVGGAWGAGLAVPLKLQDPAVDAAYHAYVTAFNFERDAKYSSSNIIVRDLLVTSEVRPGVVAATLGSMIGQTAGHGNPISATVGAMSAPIAYEIRDRVKVGLPLVLGGIPGPALLPTAVTATMTATALAPKPLPVEAMRPELLKETISKRMKVLAFGERRAPTDSRPLPPDAEKGDVARFIEELKKMSDGDKPKDKAAVEKYIKEFIATRGLTHLGGSTEPRDEWTLEDDPKLAPLVEAQKMSLLLASTAHGGEYMPFGRSFFWTPDFRRAPTSGTYLGETYPPQERDARSGQPRYVVWRTEDIAPKKNDLIQARAAVVAAWKRIKARELAMKHANDMADKIRASTATSDVTVDGLLRDLYYDVLKDARDPKVVARIRKFKIDNVAPEVISYPMMRPFALTESSDIPYPTPEMSTALLENRDKGFKTVLVLPDAPKDTYYVAVLMKRDLKRPDEFKTDVHSPIGQARVILELYRRETLKKARASVLELLKKEFNYEETEEQKKKLDENDKSGGRDE